jgi:SepF-like predicted cell division protein (DUF552 family)
MKNLLFVLLLVVGPSYGFREPIIKVTRTYSDDQINEVERQVLERYGVKVEIRVISRNQKNEITNLTFIRHGKNGQKGGYCLIDEFGMLLITPTGCRVTSIEYQEEIDYL